MVTCTGADRSEGGVGRGPGCFFFNDFTVILLYSTAFLTGIFRPAIAGSISASRFADLAKNQAVRRAVHAT